MKTMMKNYEGNDMTTHLEKKKNHMINHIYGN